MTDLSILILNYNTEKLTQECVASIIKNYKNELNEKRIEIIIFDNASGEETVKNIKKFLSIGKTFNLPIKLIESKQNLGFSKGNNLAADSAKGKYLLFLNSDTEILDKGLLKMIDLLDENGKVAILGGKLVNVDGSNQPSSGKFYNIFNILLMLFGGERLGMLRSSPNSISEVDWVSGACLMIEKNLFEKIGRFDEDFFMYVEDMEFCFRAKKMGFLTYFFPNIKIIHNNLGSSDRTYAILNIYKGLLLFYKKHKPGQLLFLKFLLKMKSFIGIFIGTIIQNQSLTQTYKKTLAIIT